MLPEVGFVKELGIAHVVARQQPVLDFLDRGDGDGTVTLEIPPEIVLRAKTVAANRDTVLESRPRVLDRQYHEHQPQRRSGAPVQNPAKETDHAGRGDLRTI